MEVSQKDALNRKIREQQQQNSKEKNRHLNFENEAIPLADSEPAVVTLNGESHQPEDSSCSDSNRTGQCSSSLSGSSDRSSSGFATSISDQMARQLSLDPDFSPDEAEEKAKLISQVGHCLPAPSKKSELHQFFYWHTCCLYFKIY